MAVAPWREHPDAVTLDHPPVGLLACVDSNLEAFQAVLDDLGRRGVRRVWLVGNLVGYGPDPAACLDLARARCELVVAGRFDLPVRSGEDAAFNRPFVELFAWIRRRLDPRAGPEARARDAWYLGLPIRHDGPELTLAYGSARDPSDIVLPSDLAFGSDKADDLLAAGPGLQVVAGDGTPGLISGAPAAWTAAAAGDTFVLPARALLLPGWVGRPPMSGAAVPADRARYAVLEAGGVATWHEVAYDRSAFEANVRRSGLPAPIEQRILSGR